MVTDFPDEEDWFDDDDPIEPTEYEIDPQYGSIDRKPY